MLLGDAEVLADVKHRINSGAGAVTAWVGCLAVVESNGLNCQTPTCAPAPRTYGPWELRCCCTHRRAGRRHDRTRHPDSQGTDPRAGRRTRPRRGARNRPRLRQPKLTCGDPRPFTRHPGPRRGRTRRTQPGRGDHRRHRRHHRRARRRPAARHVERTSARGQTSLPRANTAPPPANPPSPSTARGSRSPPTSARRGRPRGAAEGADSVGLVRTEFLFLNRDRAPDLQEQVAEYLAIADALGGRRVTFRTLDVGGDKPLTYLPMPVEENPFLGHRGIRLSARPSGPAARAALSHLPSGQEDANQCDVPDGDNHRRNPGRTCCSRKQPVLPACPKDYGSA